MWCERARVLHPSLSLHLLGSLAVVRWDTRRAVGTSVTSKYTDSLPDERPVLGGVL